MRVWLKDRLWPALKSTLSNWSKDDGFQISAAMAYYAAFSLFPLCMILIAVLGFVMRFWTEAKNQQEQLLGVVEQNVSSWLADQLQAILAGAEMKAGVGGPLGLAMLILAAIGIFTQFENLFDRVWGTPPARGKGLVSALRSALFDRLVAFLMLLGVGLLVILVFLANLLLSSFRPYVVQWPGGQFAWQFGQIALTVFFNALLIGAIYKVLPRAPVTWKEAIGGGILVALVWQIGQRIFERFVIADHYTAYGVVGSFIAVMLWMYYASAVIFLGAEFVHALCAQSSDKPDS